jgi:hypothetical protein
MDRYYIGDWVTICGDGGDIQRVIAVHSDGVALDSGENKGFDSLRLVSDDELRRKSEQARTNAVALVAEADEIDEYLTTRKRS